MSRRYKFKAACLVCGHSEMVHHESKEGYKEVTVCPKCNGAFVDVWHKHKYINKQSNEIEIVMGSVDKPPKIKLSGIEIDGIVTLEYVYVTKDAELGGIHNFMVQYCDRDTNTIRTVSANKIVEG